ncbi:hypothetical protein BTEBP_200032 [Brochothrix thermosphacta]|nr:hypothetical protein BTEBP_200032 [Brochothrix thermosphacta]
MKNYSNIVTELTLEEKASLCSGLDFWHLKGIERLNVPSIMMTDGPHGMRKQRPDAKIVYQQFVSLLPQVWLLLGTEKCCSR